MTTSFLLILRSLLQPGTRIYIWQDLAIRERAFYTLTSITHRTQRSKVDYHPTPSYE